MCRRSRLVTNLWNLDSRFRLMDEFGDYRQVISIGSPPIETYSGPAKCRDLAESANDEMAELVSRHPDRFAGFLAALPMNDADATAGAFNKLASGGMGISI